MTDERFKRLVAALERESRRAPGLYAVRTALLGAFGYAFICVVAGAMLAALIGIIALMVSAHRVSAGGTKLAIFLLIGLVLVGRSLFVRFERPDGIPVGRGEAPALFGLLDDLRRQLRAPRFHQVLLTDELNAAIVQRPRLGLFGWQQNFVILGLPLLEAFTFEQTRAVLAHEMGHLSRQHSRLAGWVYRVQQTWQQVLVSLEAAGHRAGGLFGWFFRRYAPYFAAYSFVLRRADE